VFSLKKQKTKKVYDAINENPDAVNLSPLIETVPQNKAIIEFHAIACAGIFPFFYTIQHQSLYSFRKKPHIVLKNELHSPFCFMVSAITNGLFNLL
jgi:hypothetical protein